MSAAGSTIIGNVGTPFMTAALDPFVDSTLFEDASLEPIDTFAMVGSDTPSSPPASIPPPNGSGGGNDGDGSGSGPKLAGLRTGILKHGEHLADLVLDVAPGAAEDAFPGLDLYERFIDQFIGWIRAGSISELNEKIDGSPAIVLGFDADNRPYVAYKLGIERKGAPKLVRTVAEAAQLYGNSPIAAILADCIRVLRPRLKAFSDPSLVFQADLLFTPNNGARTVENDAVIIRANPSGLAYRITKHSKLHPFVSNVQLGLVVHTVGRRVIDEETGTVARVEPLDDADAVEAFVRTLRSDGVFAVDPWTRDVRIDRGKNRFTDAQETEIRAALSGMRAGLAGMSADFRKQWASFLPTFRIFLNTSLKAGHNGGLYQAAAANEPFDFDRICAVFRTWITERANTLRISPSGAKRWMAPRRMPADFDALVADSGDDLRAALAAYYDANRILFQLKPHMRGAYTSKLGGGPIEGIMVTDETSGVKVKLVDRLEFTMHNFAGEQMRTQEKRVRRATSTKQAPKKFAPATKLPPPLDRWRAGAAFFIGKMQPPHAGHIALIGAAMQEWSPSELFVLASDKAPDLTAETWKGWGVAARKKDVQAGDYTHVFSPALRTEILQQGLPEGVHAHVIDTSAFWRFLNRAAKDNRKGAVALIVGQKEMDEGRYDAQVKRYADRLRLMPMPMQQEGISATAVRQAVRRLAEQGDPAAYDFLKQAFAFVTPARARDRIIGRLIQEWLAVDAVVGQVI